jgi:hypothetical protein
VGSVFRTCPDRPWGPPILLYNGYRVFPGDNERPGRDAEPSPPSSAVVMKGYSYTSTPPIGRTACTKLQCLYNGALYRTACTEPQCLYNGALYRTACTEPHSLYNDALYRTACTEPQCLYNGALYLFTFTCKSEELQFNPYEGLLEISFYGVKHSSLVCLPPIQFSSIQYVLEALFLRAKAVRTWG